MSALQPGTPSSPSLPEPAPSGFTWKIFVAGLLLVGGVFYFWAGHASGPEAPPPGSRMPFGVEEQQYASSLEIQNISLSRAENFIHQEVTYLAAELVNKGGRSLGAVQLTVEFTDELQQVVLRESRVVLTSREPSMAPGDRCSVEISFDHIPPSWNMQQPAVRVTGLQFAATKQ